MALPPPLRSLIPPMRRHSPPGPGCGKFYLFSNESLRMGVINKTKIEKTWIVRLGPEEIGILLRPGGRPRNESGPVGEDAPREKASRPPSDAGVEGGPRFLLTRFRRTHRLVRSSLAGLSPGRCNSLTRKESLFYFGLLCNWKTCTFLAASRKIPGSRRRLFPH
jgi:hypothetical protein